MKIARALLGLMAGTVLALAAQGASAEVETIRVAALRADTMIRFKQAEEAGYLAKEGLRVEISYLGSGPAVMSALVSGSADVGYSAVVPAIFAHAAGQPVRMVMTLATESGKPGEQGTWIGVKGSSPIKTVAGLKGHTVAINASGALCELMVRDQLAKAGVSWDDVKKIVVPFPQMQAALELGNADAACFAEPFFAAASVAPKVQARALTAGMLAALSPDRRIAEDGLFVTTAWGEKHRDALVRLEHALTQATDDFKKDPERYRSMMVKEFKLDPAVGKKVAIYFAFGGVATDAGDLQPILDAMLHYGMLAKPMSAESFILPISK
ncbi:MAG: ABC transporter substrate-binding protein [Burkholderiales bacterium]|nr:ABC transporter substrate-binding protein [Burkholderiales bacterium]MDE2394186.1 ABC transporter substrate-binding protein [Burkholderiales bacterium]MDE2453886.1 ABC transporter substrate-binding protein [Burkholderiales bacterium]